MAEYIDREKIFPNGVFYVSAENPESSLNELINRICNLPTADVVQVVRCKDCIHRDPEDKKCDCSFQAMGGILPMDDDDFCSYGERRKEDEEK